MSIPFSPVGWVSRAILSGPSSSFGYEIQPHAIPIESSETNSYPYPRLSIDAPYSQLNMSIGWFGAMLTPLKLEHSLSRRSL
jgi:hypothetical protein